MRAFDATERQLLWKAQLPLALPTIMAGINQTLMMSLSMVVIGSIIAVGGLGQTVLCGLGIVALAIVLDRLTHSLSRQKRRPGELWHQGPVGLVRAVTGNKQS